MDAILGVGELGAHWNEKPVHTLSKAEPLANLGGSSKGGRLASSQVLYLLRS